MAEPTPIDLPAVPDHNDLATQSTDALDVAKSLYICDALSYTVAGNYAAGLTMLELEIKDRFKESKSAAHKAHQAICALEASFLDPVSEAKKIIRNKGLAWAQEARREEEARRQAEEEERLRLEREAKQQEVFELEQAGKLGQAQQLAAEPIAPLPVPKTDPVPKGPMQIVEHWQYRVTDKNKVPEEYKMLNHAAIMDQVTQLRGLTAIPGIEAYDAGQARARGR